MRETQQQTADVKLEIARIERETKLAQAEQARQK